ncbi:hypothetical protein AB0L57_22475 [Nocardia sp. NPDC052254]|uniref:hypothetical protein n=1 Tax=Nocardia sp. NPDC052254 TaxID=3155681 RepID=UPI0034430772
MRSLTRAVTLAALAASATVLVAQPALADTGQPVTGPVTGLPEHSAAEPNPADSTPPQDSAPVDPTTEYLNAFDAIAGAWADTSTPGQVVGTAAGLVVGCPLGAVTGGTLTIVTPPLTPLGIVGGCLLGASTAGFLGGLAGGIVTGAPTLANTVGDQYQSLHSKGLIAQQLPAGQTGN